MESAVHKSYTASFKLTVVECAEKIGNRAAARKFVVNERCVRRWRAEKNNLERMPKFKRAQRGGVVPWPHLEDKLESWIKEQQDKALPVSMNQIRHQAKLMAEQMGITDFTGGSNWCYRFMKRKNLTASSKSCVKNKLHIQNSEEKSSLCESIYPSAVFKSYTAGFKLCVVERAEEVGNRAASREFSIDERCVRRWRSEKEDLEKMPKFKRSQRRGVAWPKLEENLAAWVSEQQILALPVTMEKIRAQAKLIAEQMGITRFTGGLTWYYSFLKRKKVFADRKCSAKLNLVANRFEETAFVENSIAEIMQQLELVKAQVISMAVVSYAFDCLLDRPVICEDESTSISGDRHKKIFFTCMLASAANGNKLKPFIIFKQRGLSKGNYASEVIIRSNEEGWKCGKVVLEWLNEVWRKRKGAIFEPRGILIVDSVLAELLESVKPECEKVSATVVTVPKRLSPLNSVIDESFRSEMQNRWEEWTNKMSPPKKGEIRKVTLEEITRWVIESWKSINVSTIISGFKDAKIFASDDEQASGSKVKSDMTEYNEVLVGNDEFLKQLFNSDSDESDFDGFR